MKIKYKSILMFLSFVLASYESAAANNNSNSAKQNPTKYFCAGYHKRLPGSEPPDPEDLVLLGGADGSLRRCKVPQIEFTPL